MQDIQILETLVSDIKEKPVLVIGDIMLDRFVYGAVERISPESPVPVLAVKREDYMLGGAGNALANLVGLNAKASIISIIGNDDNAAILKEQCAALEIACDGLVIDPSRPTTVKTRFLAGHQQLLRTDSELKTAISDDVAKAIKAHITTLIPQNKALILSDYGKGLLRDDIITAAIEAANEAGIPIIVDPKGHDFTKYKGATAITPNKKELSEATQGAPVDTDQQVINAANTLISGCGIKAVVATRSKDGISVIEGQGDTTHYRSADIEVFDVSGAGDTVIATLAAILAAGGDLKQAASLANIAGSIVVTKVGTAPIRAAELSEALHGDLGDVLIKHYSKSKTLLRQADCLPWDEAAERIKRWKAQGFKVGFTNGCFDVLHAGHVNYLNQAREQCDRLVVGVNADSSVRILKGPERPVHDEASRADVLGALSSVDLVVLFGAKEQGDDNTANALLGVIQPDLYVKGGDYAIEEIPEAPTVMGYGGEVRVMSVYEGHSTTNSIKRIKAGEAA
ncbi:MAG: D-glycero-beta-D-manno-heptose-7-phosphate kinase [Alphaproteobacteria bacterium]